MRKTRAAALLVVATAVGTLSWTSPAAAEDVPSGRFEQTIVLAHIPDTPVHQAVAVDATATSLLPVTVSAAGVCTLQQLAGGAVIVATGPGTCTVTVSQPGDDRWLPAPDVDQAFAFVGAGSAGVEVTLDGPQVLIAAKGLPLEVPVSVSPDDPAGVTPTGSVTVTPGQIPGGPSCTGCEPVSAPLDPLGKATVVLPGALTTGLTPGAYSLTIDYAGDSIYGQQQLIVPGARIVPPGGVIEGTAPIVVSLGDSYISGEAGRWAGNAFASDEAWRTDTGANAYLDLGGIAESIPGCHRSASAEIHIEQAGANVVSVNLACSGAQTATTNVTPEQFTPGLDYFQREQIGQRSQTLELYRLASANPERIRMVVLSIGGNDFHFGTIVKTCLLQYLFSVSRTPCSKLSSVTDMFAPANVKVQTAAITGAIRNIDDAMAEAGYTSDEWTLLVQNYPSPVPESGSRVRYGEGALSGRQTTGGCGMFNADMAYANDVMLDTISSTIRRATRLSGLPNVEFLDLRRAYVGNRLCEKGVDLVGALNEVERWTDSNALLNSEWVAPIRFESAIPVGSPYMLQESMHPNYWGQLANQVCVKLAWNGGDVRGGACVRGDGAYDPNPDTNRAYPVMVLQTDD